MDKKVFNPGVVGLTNYRTQLIRPVYSVIPYGTRAGSPNTIRLQNRGRGRPLVQYVPNLTPGFRPSLTAYVQTTTKTKKKKKQYKHSCCLYIKGRKISKPKFCPQKYKKYRKRFYW